MNAYETLSEAEGFGDGVTWADGVPSPARKRRQQAPGGGCVFASGTATTGKDILAREPRGCLRGQRPLY